MPAKQSFRIRKPGLPGPAKGPRRGWLLGWLLSGIVCATEQHQFSEHELKAAFLYNFAYFASWPDDDIHANFNICSYSASPVTPVLARLVDGERLHNRPFRLIVDPGSDRLSECQILFIPLQQERITAAALEQIKPYPVLTVSDIPDFEQRGGMIRLASEGRRIVPVIQLHNVSNGNLRISSKLLRSSHLVE
ncbi:YfiR family protein [Methylomonas sp. CM2]|uniref:YfiR family protein n=1 Tax=Methylomonas sp. CM2 TaxID=3417647 RepID=UPI003CEF48E1